jgi:hypothetical protein
MVAVVVSATMIKNGNGGRRGAPRRQTSNLPVGLVPEFYVSSTLAPGHTGQ